MTWLTMTNGVCIDVAVAQATQTLQQLQQQQAALYSGMGAKYMPQYYPPPKQSYVGLDLGLWPVPPADSKTRTACAGELPGSTLQICSLGL